MCEVGCPFAVRCEEYAEERCAGDDLAARCCVMLDDVEYFFG